MNSWPPKSLEGGLGLRYVVYEESSSLAKRKQSPPSGDLGAAKKAPSKRKGPIQTQSQFKRFNIKL